MPLIVQSDYKSPFLQFNGHLQTIIPAFQSVAGLPYQRIRISTPDSDFLDLDFISSNSDTVIVLCHGLEGSSSSNYILKSASWFSKAEYDVCAWNYRGCSGEPNIKESFYHSGYTNDLERVISHLTLKRLYKKIFLIGFSLGGNIVLKYLGDSTINKPSAIKSAAAISAPCDLLSGAHELARPSRKLYMQRFLDSFFEKFSLKNSLRGTSIDLNGYAKIRNFFEFDNRYTAPMFGFLDVYDYYSKASSLPYLSDISVPSLMINALNDPFLGKDCFPREIVRENNALHGLFLKNGGHVGFPSVTHTDWVSFTIHNFFKTSGI